MIDRIIDVQEAADLWGLSADHVKKLCREKKIVAKKIGNSWAIDREQGNPKKYKVQETKEEKK